MPFRKTAPFALFGFLLLALPSLAADPPAPPLPFLPVTDECPGYVNPPDAMLAFDGALAEARATKRRVLLDLGANDYPWCFAMCDLLRRPDLAALVARGYVHLKIDIGVGDKNVELQRRLKIFDAGTPSFAIFEPSGEKLIYQTLEKMEGRPGAVEFVPELVADFLRAWSPPPPKAN